VTRSCEGEHAAIRFPVHVRLKNDSDQSPPNSGCFCDRIQTARKEGDLHPGGEIVSSCGPRGVRYCAAVVIDEGNLGSFSRCGGPSHTIWERENVRKKYAFHAHCWNTQHSVRNVLQAIADEQKKAIGQCWRLFSLPGG